MLPPLNVRIGADTSDLEAGLEGAQESVDSFSRRAQRSVQALGDGATNLGRAMLPVSGIIAGTATAAFGLATATTMAGNEIAKTARAAGMNAQSFQEYRFALTQATDATEGDLAMATRNLNRLLAEAAQGSDTAIASLERIGFTSEQAASGLITTEDALGATIAALGETASATEAAGLGAELLGSRIGATLGPQLREVSGDVEGLRGRFRELGLGLSDETLAASEAAADQFSEIRQQIGQLGHEIGAAMLPVLSSLAGTLQSTVIPAMRRMAEGIAGAIEWFGQLPEGVQTAAAVVATALGAAGPMLMAVGTALRVLGSLAFIFSPAGAIAVAIAAGIAIWVRWGDEIIQIVTEAFQWLSDTFSGFVDTVTEFAQNVRDGFVQAGEWIRESFNGLVEWFQELPMRFLEFGRNIITGLWDGLRAAWDEFSIVDTVRGWGSNIAGSFASALGIESPSRVFHEFGRNIGQGLHDGITSTFGMVSSAVDGLSTSVVGGALGMARDVVGAMGQMFQGSKPIAMAMALINTFQGITEALKLPFPASLAAVARVAAQGFAAVQGIQNTKPGSGPSGGGAGQASAAASAPAEMPTQTLRFDFGGQNAMGMEQIVDLLNQAHDRGYRIRAVMA
jgi:hypothetical protein